jgi:hypothetical protein
VPQIHSGELCLHSRHSLAAVPLRFNCVSLLEDIVFHFGEGLIPRQVTHMSAKTKNLVVVT